MSISLKNNTVYHLFHRGLGLVYLTAFIPLFFQIKTLIGSDGLLPAEHLLKLSYKNQGYFLSFMQFPSVFHFFNNDITLFVIVGLGCVGALMLLLNIYTFSGALLAWISFISITTIGGDFFVIIIDLFLAEVGFLALFSSYFLSRYNYVPEIVRIVFLMLNFKLWFGMGINKFYYPQNVWTDFTFFNYFFHAQPMPTPLAPKFNQAPQILKTIAIIGVLLAEIVVPFFVFGKRNLRIIAFIVFLTTSLLIQVNGNYGYFNILSIVLAIVILKDKNLKLHRKFLYKPMKMKLISFILVAHIFLQGIQTLYLFNPNPHSAQNHFNHIFNNIQTENKFTTNLLYPLKWIEYWRICNSYGVFKDIPYYHGEIRLSGSYDGKNWEIYEFKHVPSAFTDYLGFYAPYYPRLDHLMFYETLAAQNYQWNLLNPYYNEENSWICRFVEKLLTNKYKGINQLMKKNPFNKKNPPQYIKAEVFRLEFSIKKERNWSEKAMGITKVYSKENSCSGRIISMDEALKTTYSKEE